MRLFSAQSIRAGFIAVVIAVSSFSVGLYSTRSASAFNSGGSGCSVSVLAPKANAFTVSGNTATTSVQVSGPASCRETVSLSSWNAPVGSTNFRPFANQQFVAGKTRSDLAPGMHTFSIAVNNTCSFQVDILLGPNQRSANGDANFTQAELMGFSQVNAGVCGKPQAPAQTPAAPASPTTVNNTTVVQQQQQQSQSTQAAPMEQTPAATPAQTQQQEATTPAVSASQSQSQQQPAPTTQQPETTTPQTTPAQAVFSCDALTVSQNNTTPPVTATITDFRTTATNGATFTNADIDWGDTTTTSGTTSVIGMTHLFPSNVSSGGSTFTISVVAHFNVNGQDLTAGGPNCQKQITITQPPETPAPTTPAPTPTTPAPTTTTPTTSTPQTAPTQLVNTGPGNLIGIFVVSTALGTLGYRFFLRRSLSRL